MTGTDTTLPHPGGAGRHRLGSAKLRHCRDIDAVRARLTEHRPGVHRRNATPRQRPGGPRWAGTLVATVVAGIVAISGWYTAAGASAVAQMISR